MDLNTSYPPRSSPNYPEDVSPPDSPLASGHGHGHGHSRKSSCNVSPISTDNPSPFGGRSPPLKQGRYSSNLPVPKTKKFWKLPDKAPTSPDQDSTTVRWDEYSGEPTTSEKGKPPSTTPGAVRLNEDPTPGRLNSHNFGTSTHITGGSIARKRVGSREISDAPIQMRPEWKGAGGRHAIVPQPIDKPLPLGQSPTFSMGQRKKQIIEEERQAELERQENEQLERERAEQESLEAERRELQRQEEERMENRRREEERAEQVRLDRESEEEERRTRERVVQARRERDLAQQAQRAKEAAARRAQREELEAAQTAQKETDEAARRENEQVEPNTGLGLAFHPTTRDLTPQPGHFDPNELGQPRTAFAAVDGSSSDSVSSSTSESKARHRDVRSMADDKRSPLARNPSNEEMQARRSQPSSDVPQPSQQQQYNPKTPTGQSKEWKPRSSSLPKDEQDPSLIESRFRANLQNMTIQEEPKSRFSTTTYATTAYNDSPPATPDMGPDSPSMSNSTTPNSILNRRRPVPTSGITPRKPTPSEISAPTSAPYHVVTPDSDKGSSKVLPKAPAGAPKVDQVKTLEARKDALRRRKHNIETVIHELTDVVQPSSIAYDKASRQEIKKTVEQLRKELAEVVKDEHETGLKLHRAWKRHEDFADFEPTSIWVRRVTH